MPGRNAAPTRAQTRATLTSTVPTAHPMCHVSGLPLYLEFGCVVCAWGGAVTVEGCLPLLPQPAQERQFLLMPFPTRQTGQASSSFRNPQNAPLHNFHLNTPSKPDTHRRARYCRTLLPVTASLPVWRLWPLGLFVLHRPGSPTARPCP